MMRRTALFALAALLASCAGLEMSPAAYLEKKGLSRYEAETFDHCYGYGCRTIVPVSLPSQDWREIEAVFTPAPANAEEERKRLKSAVGLLEQKTGALAGTREDRGGTFRSFSNFQHDCVDESTNTTVYLTVLKDRGLLRFHDVRPPTTRLPLFHHAGGWPHQTAVISDQETGAAYAVDSWFHDNGAPAEIVPLAQWKDGWTPRKG